MAQIVSKKRIGLGLFLLSASAFCFQLLIAQLTSTIFHASFNTIILAFSFFGISLGGAACAFISHQNREKAFEHVSHLISLVTFFYLLTYFVLEINQREIANYLYSILPVQGESIKDMWREFLPSKVLVPCLLVCFLNLKIGFIISIFFTLSPPKKFNRLYFFDMAGAPLGCIFFFFSQEYLSIKATMAFPLVLSGLASFIFWRKYKNSSILLAISLIVVSLTSLRFLEFQPEINIQSRNFSLQKKVSKIWADWNSYTRFSLLNIDQKEGHQKAIALGNGWAHAKVFLPQKSNPPKDFFTAFLEKSPDIKNILVALAGVGMDMSHFYLSGPKDWIIDGIELNRKMLNSIQEDDQYSLGKFQLSPRFNLMEGEARTFIESSKKKYDAIFVSWSGTTVSNYLGGFGVTTQYLYTVESLESMYRSLTPHGFLFFLHWSSLGIINLWKEFAQQENIPNLSNTLLLIKSRSSNRTILAIRPSGHSPGLIKTYSKLGDQYQYNIAYPTPAKRTKISEQVDFILKKNVTSPPPPEELFSGTRKVFFSASDDRPYFDQHSGINRLLKKSFWKQVFGIKKVEKYFYVQLTRFALVFLIILSIIFFLPRKTAYPLDPIETTYFAAIGFGFMSLQVGLIQMLGLWVGDPGQTIALCLGVMVFASGLGSLCLAGRNDGPFKNILFPLLPIALWYIFSHHRTAINSYVLSHDSPIRIIFTVLTLLIGTFPLGRFFPRGLTIVAKKQEASIPWGWAVTGLGGGIAGTISPLLIREYGFSKTLALSASFYLLTYPLLLKSLRKVPKN
jgi:hypothetical protein